MKNISLRTCYVLFLSLLALTTLSACKDDARIESIEPNTWQTTVITVREEELAEEYTVIGSVVADTRIDISSRISSYIHKLTVQEGDAIDEGQLLIVLDDEELEHSINQTRAAVQTAQAVLTDVETDLKRFDNLLRQGSISEIKVRKTQLQKSTAIENLNRARAALSAANSQRQYIQIRSPAAGIVTKRHLQAGGLATPGLPLLTIESRDNLKFETFIAESQLANIKLDDTVILNIENLGNSSSLTNNDFVESLIGVVTQIVYSGDPVARSYKVSIALPPRPDIYTGMFGRATFVVGKSNNITIPDSAMVKKGGLDGVYLVDEENKVWFRWLRVRRLWPGKAEIAAGLSSGERILAVIPANIREGDLIQAPGSARDTRSSAR
ncbi:MAG: efflux RND transporter periplasmic adaptor subunit [Gammaproteobacteria bacterium]|nr:MAG: efflux RND transporter periplasmic adaptor subunit [Gammaproteobacteria bacterium]RLA52651.1 MAG: efflux RND transporter periplasmic adaptor subunit [Gammaproteobacteria bacterium]